MENTSDANQQGFNTLLNASQSGFDKDQSGLNTLILASENGEDKVVENIIKNGADINRVDENGFNALMMACKNGHDKVVDILIKYGADIHHTEKNGINAFMMACANGNVKIVNSLIKIGVDIHHVEQNGLSALFLASGLGQDTVINALLQCGIDIHDVNQDGVNALMVACMFGRCNVVEYLINSKADIHHIDENGNNALMMASEAGHANVLEVLINSGINILDVNRLGQDALLLASENGQIEVVNVLLHNQIKLSKVHHNNSTLKAYLPSQRNDSPFISTWYLIDVCFTAFENGHLNVLEKVCSLSSNFFVDETSKAMFDCISELLKQGLNLIGVHDWIKNHTMFLSSSFDITGYQESISICMMSVVYYHKNKQCLSPEILLSFADQIMVKYCSMKKFDELQFFILQKSLNNINDMFCQSNNEKGRFHFFSRLLLHEYPDITIKHLKEHNLLDVQAPDFSLSFVKDTLVLLLSGCWIHMDFALQLAQSNIIKFFTDQLCRNKDNKTSQWNCITFCIVYILIIIASNKELRKYFTGIDMKLVLSGFASPYPRVKLSAYILPAIVQDCSEEEYTSTPEDEQTLVNYIQKATKEVNKFYKGFPLRMLLQGLSKLLQRTYTEKDILPLLESFVKILASSDPDEQEYTTDCIEKLSSKKEASEKMISNEELIDRLKNLNVCGPKNISDKIGRIFWKASRTCGNLPKKLEKIVSDDFPEEFTIEKKALGCGAFGSVHIVRDKNYPEGINFVAKRLNSRDEKHMEMFRSEASILMKVKHRNIVQFHGYQNNEEDIYLFMEFIKMGTLSTFIKQHTRLNEDLTRQFTIQILEGVKYLHENNILHLDIKGSNILMVDESNIKLTDFGLSTMFSEEEGVEAERGTARYMAPEMINCPDGRIFQNACSLDIWSIGSTVVEMMTGSPPNSTTTSIRVLFKIAKLQKPSYTLPENSSMHLKDFLEKTFKPKAEERPSAEALLREDPFITG